MSWYAILAAVVAYFFVGFWWAKYKAWQPLIWFFERILMPWPENRDYTKKYKSYKEYRQKNVPWVKGLNFWLWLLTLGLLIFVIIVGGIFIALPRGIFTITGNLINGKGRVKPTPA